MVEVLSSGLMVRDSYQGFTVDDLGLRVAVNSVVLLSMATACWKISTRKSRHLIPKPQVLNLHLLQMLENLV